MKKLLGVLAVSLFFCSFANAEVVGNKEVVGNEEVSKKIANLQMVSENLLLKYENNLLENKILDQNYKIVASEIEKLQKQKEVKKEIKSEPKEEDVK